ncbi:MAG: T9SS type A sorting domain-containing protein [Bacteroidia bacterium]
MKLIDLTGRTVYERDFGNEATLELDFSNQAKGLYLLQLSSDNKKRTEKLQIN